MSKDKKLKTGGKLIHPSSRKAKQISRLECHAGRVVKKRQNTKAKNNNLRDRVQWFKDQLNETQLHLSKQQVHELVQRYLQRFQDELEQIELKNQIGQRQKTPQYASRKALIESTINAEKHEYETHGFEVPELTRPDAVKVLRTWDGSVRFMPRLKLCLIKQNNSTSNKNDAADDDQIVSIDNENESMESDVE
ncbi:unnamed protein product [Rotaria socialis]|uniref:Translation machinery-associated protein 16 n=1 Tax=Rotaria socialis TaxID=392032 RepID=A0A820J359_9BILA|nr:unnamed protein product [Rotaria socialis]CAF3409368.1 unnamed protein product [Rotaria socialis]CAF3439677.1 unnamed protein product [Rotaria socialis]CAF3452144.1 unnamed protein product [Rotaria socialis]CAF3547630.1 unnamed protein product [Rotaria socialis]